MQSLATKDQDHRNVDFHCGVLGSRALCFHLVISFVTPWTVARQAPLSVGFPRQEYWSGLPLSSPGDLPNPGIKLESPALADGLSRKFPNNKHIIPEDTSPGNLPTTQTNNQEQTKPGLRGVIPLAPALGRFLCSWNSKGRKGDGVLLSKSKELRASPPRPGRLPFANREEKRKKALDVAGSGGGCVVTGVAGSTPSLAGGAWNFLLAGRAHPPRNGKQSLASGPQGEQGFDNQALLFSLPRPSPMQRGNRGRWALCLNQESASGRFQLSPSLTAECQS